jgi:hypothetical protein
VSGHRDQTADVTLRSSRRIQERAQGKSEFNPPRPECRDRGERIGEQHGKGTSWEMHGTVYLGKGGREENNGVHILRFPGFEQVSMKVKLLKR